MGQLSNQNTTLPETQESDFQPDETPSLLSDRSDRKRPRRLIIADEARLVKAFQDGATLMDLAVQYGVNHRTAAAALTRAKVKSRHTRLSRSEIDEAIRLYRSGLSLP